MSDFEQPDFDEGQFDLGFNTQEELIHALGLEEDSERDPQEPARVKTPYQKGLSLADSVFGHPLDDDQAVRLAGVYAQLAVADRLERVFTGLEHLLTAPRRG